VSSPCLDGAYNFVGAFYMPAEIAKREKGLVKAANFLGKYAASNIGLPP